MKNYVALSGRVFDIPFPTQGVALGCFIMALQAGIYRSKQTE